MSFLALFKGRPTTASQARERLQMLLAHERATAGPSDLVAVLREEILAVIARHASVERDGVRIKVERGASVSTLGVSIDLPDLSTAARAA